MPFKAYYLDPQGKLRRGLDERAVQAVLAAQEGLLWVDIGETTGEDARFLERTFKFHPLAIEDCLEGTINTPKVEDFGDYLFLVLHGINYAAETHILQTAEMDLFLGPHYVVSNHNLLLYSVEAVARLVELDGRPMRRGVEFLAHDLVDALVNNIMPVIDRLGERADEIEEKIFQTPHASTLEGILQLKRSSLRLRRAMMPQRAALGQLSRGDFSQISREAQVFYRDVYDDVVRIEGFNDNLRERLDTILATYMSAISNQQNEAMKTLSVIAAVFLPLTLLAGIYGMNFEHMPELAWEWSYFAVLGFMLLVASGVAWWLWVRKWFALGRKRLTKFVPAAVDPERLVNYIGHVTTMWPHR